MLNLTIYKSDRDTLNVSACEMVIVNNVTYFNSGTYTQFLLTTQGCDSTLTIHVDIKPGQNTTSFIEVNSCGAYELNGQTYNQSGTYSQQLVNAAGCDSTLTLVLNVYPKYEETIFGIECDSAVFDGKVYYESGTYTHSYQTAAGCDSIIHYSVQINQHTDTLIEVSICEAFTFNGQDYTESGTYTQLLFNSVGCDSVITLVLHILEGQNTLNLVNRTAL